MRPPAAAAAVVSAVTSATVPLINDHFGDLGVARVKDSTINLMQLLTLTQWQLSCGSEQKVLFTHCLIFATKKIASHNAIVRFARPFAEMGPQLSGGPEAEGEAGRAWSEVLHAVQDLELEELCAGKVTKLQDHLQTVSTSVLEADWKLETWHSRPRRHSDFRTKRCRRSGRRPTPS